jgi:quinol monooxygenase YgiN
MKTGIIVLIFAAFMLAACGETCGNKACCCKNAAEMKKVISAQVFIKPEKVDAFLAFSKDLIEKSRAEEGCISYSLYQDPHDKTTFLFFEEWKNQAAIDFHFATEHFKMFKGTIGDFAAASGVTTVYDAISKK